jgi:hypothetical protein
VVTPYVGAVADVSATTSLYASYTDIFDPQTMRDRRGIYLDPLKGKNYEGQEVLQQPVGRVPEPDLRRAAQYASHVAL